MMLFSSKNINKKFSVVYDYIKSYYDEYNKCRPDQDIESAEFERNDSTGELNVSTPSINKDIDVIDNNLYVYKLANRIDINKFNKLVDDFCLKIKNEIRTK